MDELLFTIDAIKGTNSDFFYGRTEILRAAVKNLKKSAQTCVVFGERGIGKTSFAWQVISLLQGQNEHFKSIHDDLRIQNNDFLCITIKDLTAPIDSNDLLVQAIAPSRSPNSLFTLVPELYNDENFLLYLLRTYDIDLYNMESLNIIARTSEKDEIIRRLFNDVFAHAKSLRPGTQFIVFCDEVDKMKSRQGLGDLIKNTNYVKFFFAGIGESIDEIILDHKSAARKLIGGRIELPRLGPNDIRAIYRHAEKESRFRIKFSHDFISLVIRHSGGFPWIAQHVGDQAITHLNINLTDFSSSRPFHITANLFGHIMPFVRNQYSLITKNDIDWECLLSNF